MVLRTVADLQQAKDFISENTIISFDLETTGLNPRKDLVVGVGLHNGTDGVYLLHLAWDGEKLEEILPKKDIKDILNLLRGKKLVGHNLSFDIRFTYNYFGVDLIDSIWSDSMLAKHTVEEDPIEFGGFGLKEIATRLYGDDSKDEQVAMKASIKANGGKINEYYKADPLLLAKYCLKDCQLSLDVNNYYLQKIADEGLTKFYFEDEVMPLYREVTIPMELHGIPVDVSYMQHTQTEIAVDLEQLEKQVLLEIEPFLGPFRAGFYDRNYPVRTSGSFAQTLALLTDAPVGKTPSGAPSLAAKELAKLDPQSPLARFMEVGKLDSVLKLKIQKTLHGNQPTFNLRSPKDLSYLFFSILREKPTSFTEHGSPQVDADFLFTIMDKYPFVKNFYIYKRLDKIKSTYIDRFLEEQEDGIYYPSYQQHRTTSGRYAGSFQQIPRPIEDGDDEHELIKKYNNRIREFFIAKKGDILIDDDYESAEPRIFAHISGEQAIKDIFARGDCFYSTIAILVEGLEGVSANKKAPNFLGKIDKAKRQAAKIYALGIPYSMGGFKLQYEINVSLDTAEALVKKYLQTFPNLHRWMKDTYRKVYTEGRVQTEAGRIRHLDEAVRIYEKYGDAILHDLDLWKKYHEEPAIYAEAKKARRKFKNYLANGSNVQIQGLVASMINRASIAIAREYKSLRLDARICGSLHDELLVYSSEKDKLKAAAILQDKMENTMKFSVPMVAVPSFGKNFREAKG